MKDLRTNTKPLTDVVIERYETTQKLINSGDLVRDEAALIHYVFAVYSVLSDPKKHCTKEVEVLERDLESCEHNLIKSFNGRVLNRSALEGCKAMHARVYHEFTMRGKKKTNSDWGGLATLSTEAQEILSRVMVGESMKGMES